MIKIRLLLTPTPGKMLRENATEDWPEYTRDTEHRSDDTGIYYTIVSNVLLQYRTLLSYVTHEDVGGG
jgi:hypothetical protein